MKSAAATLAATCFAAPLAAQSVEDHAIRTLAAYHKLHGFSEIESLDQAQRMVRCLDEGDIHEIAALEDPASAGVLLAFQSVETIMCSVNGGEAQ